VVNIASSQELRNRFEIKYENGLHVLYLDGELAERFVEKDLAEKYIESAITVVRVGEMDYRST